MAEHAKLSASGSKKWLNCPGSVAFEKEFPDEESEFAKEGTTAHALGGGISAAAAQCSAK